jgi:hypothetical protein
VDIVRFDLAFTHELHTSQRRLFLLVTDTCTKGDIDEVIQVPQLQLQTSWRVIGLPAVTPQCLYIVRKSGRQQRFNIEDGIHNAEDFEAIAEEVSQNEANGNDDDERMLLHCPWEISFM